MSYPSNPLGKLGNILTGSTPSTAEASYWGGDIPFVTPAELDQLAPVVDTPRTLTIAGSEQTRILSKDAVMVCCIGSLGKIGIAGRTLVTNQQINSIEFDPAKVFPKYGYYACQLLKPKLIAMAPTTTVAIVSKSKFAQLEIPAPPLTQQRRIAAILDKASALRAKRQESLAQLDSLVQSIFLQMFGDPKHNEKGWPLISIEATTTEMRGGAALEPNDFIEEGFPILHKGAIKPGGIIKVDSKKKTFAEREYALGRPQNIVSRDYIAVTLRDLVPTGPSIGLAADLRHGLYDEYLLAQGAYGLLLNSELLHADYFVQLSNMPNFRHILRQHAVGSTQIHIRNPIYRSIKIPLPPIELQRAFAARMAAIRELRNYFDSSEAKFEELFSACQYRAFRGEI